MTRETPSYFAVAQGRSCQTLFFSPRTHNLSRGGVKVEDVRGGPRSRRRQKKKKGVFLGPHVSYTVISKFWGEPFGADSEPIWSRFGADLEPIWSRFRADFEPI